MVDREAIGTGLITQQNSKFLKADLPPFKDRCMGHVLMARPVHPRRGDGGIGRHASLRNWFARVKVRVLFALPTQDTEPP